MNERKCCGEYYDVRGNKIKERRWSRIGEFTDGAGNHYEFDKAEREPELPETGGRGAGFLFAALLLAAIFACGFYLGKANAGELGLDVGPSSLRPHIAISAKPWLDMEGGVLLQLGGAVYDVTPMLHTTGRLYLEGGVGLAYTRDANQATRLQAPGLMFHDVVGVGYKISDKWLVGLRAEHWSNGGTCNPAFGRQPNGGYTYGMLRLGYRF
jgi:hypothetical protein